MRIGFYNPYFDGLGGGERYTLTLASHWSQNHEVEVFWDEPNILAVSEKRFSIDLGRVHTVPNIFATNKFFAKMAISRQYDLIFFLTDGSIPTTLARHNILHFQVPFPKILAHPFKLHQFDFVVCNSLFTQKHIDPKLGSYARVIYPPVVPVAQSSTQRKQKIILSVGRFTSAHTAKKQDTMIDVFIRMEHRLPGWKLVLAGGLLDSDSMYMNSLRKKIKGHRIILVSNISHDALEMWYQKAMIYWHAAGFGESDPRFMEHFGISTVEAMSAGAVPIVFAGGGLPEIVTHGKNGFLWKTPDELAHLTLDMIADTQLRGKVQKSAINSWKTYSEKKFTASFDALIETFTDKKS